MVGPFIGNHQYNLIKKQADILQQAVAAVADRKVVESVRSGTEAKLLECFPNMTDGQKRLLGAVTSLQTPADLKNYLASLEPHLTAFPAVAKERIAKLFPKIKKLKAPDPETIDFRYVTYLRWVDIAAGKLFMVYPLDGQLVGIEGRYTPTHKKGYCFLCGSYGELALFSAVFKKRPAHASPDYYKAVGNYLCADGHHCNGSITDTGALENFIRTVLN